MRVMAGAVAVILGIGGWTLPVDAGVECAMARGDAVHGRPFDASVGRDPRNYPPDPQVDFTWLQLDIDFSEPLTRAFSCEETLRFTTLATPLARLRLDGIDLRIESVRDLTGAAADFRYDEQRLTVRYDPPLVAGAEAGLIIRYRCESPQGGMIFALPDAGYPDRPLMIHTQGEAEFSRHWFFSHDSPNERCRTAISVLAPAELKVLSNGGLVSREEVGGGMARTRYEMRHPHTPYLVSLVIGEFDVTRTMWRGIPVEYWVPPGQAEGVERTFGKTPAMLDYFSAQLDFEYPFEKYAQAVCYLFDWGGMENTSATTLREDVVHDARAGLDSDLEGLISHELAHQWFGDVVTCRAWPHIWLNEGFATYMEAAWWEHSRGRAAYDDDIWRTMRGVGRSDRVDAVAGVVFPQYDNPDDVFSRPVSNPYSKGSCVIHMLRRELGDELFWASIQEYLRRFAWTSTETDDLRRVIEAQSGRSFERFFTQWLERPGTPHIKVEYDWDDATGQVALSLEQTQTLSTERPAFVADVPVVVEFAGGRVERRTIALRERTARITIASDEAPIQVCVDPDLHVLAVWDLRLPVAMRIHQALDGPTTAARLTAISTLADDHRDDVRAALARIVRDNERYYAERSEAASALGQMAVAAARETLLELIADERALQEHHVRAALVVALGRYRRPEVAKALIPFAENDATYTVEERATQALGRQDPTDEIIAVLVRNTQKPSHQNKIRRAAVGALARLDAQRGVEPAFDLARYGAPYRGRTSGISALGALGAAHETDRIRGFLLDLLDDPHENAVGAAISALGALGDTEAIDELESYAEGAAPADLRRRARNAIEKIRANESESEALRSLRERVASLEEKLEEVGHDEGGDPNDAD